MTNPEQAGSFRDAVRKPDVSTTRKLPTGTELRDGWLTQFGTDDDRDFRAEPRWEKPEFDVSVLKGKLTLKETSLAMFGRKPKPLYRHRHFNVARLVAAFYRCLHTPTQEKPLHASILAGCLDQDIEAHKAWWSNASRKPLNSLVENGE